MNGTLTADPSHFGTIYGLAIFGSFLGLYNQKSAPPQFRN
jgi:hypothetical protein